MKKAIAVGILAVYLLGCERQEHHLTGAQTTSFDAVEMFHLALRDSCDGRCDLRFTSALTEQSGRIARGGSYWLITSSKSSGKLEVAIATPASPGAMRISTPKGSLWFSVTTRESETKDFLKIWNESTMESWVQSLREHVTRQEAAESWESRVPKSDNP